jgi:hypothetical protein
MQARFNTTEPDSRKCLGRELIPHQDDLKGTHEFMYSSYKSIRIDSQGGGGVRLVAATWRVRISYVFCFREAMGVPAVIHAAADVKKASTKYIMHNFGHCLEHYYDDCRGLLDNDDKYGECRVCTPPWECTRYNDGAPVMLLTAGLPCQPFTKKRWHGGQSAQQGNVKRHRLWQVVLDFLHYLVHAPKKTMGMTHCSHRACL